ncbi:hypothetical protein QR680_009819 [Steinernema hermaphroditum]|uniref:Uncharacterized protein n=1 Tax=Steinernema hermaphroditum TaxID=289476 RepID=A0AA39ILR8_9BILA|nr:hypothetical protein QR680_009819 [Steinernema hermaphroditum]
MTIRSRRRRLDLACAHLILLVSQRHVLYWSLATHPAELIGSERDAWDEVMTQFHRSFPGVPSSLAFSLWLLVRNQHLRFMAFHCLEASYI